MAPATPPLSPAPASNGTGSYVYSVAVQADGKVLVGGDFTGYNGTTGQNRIIRLNADGSRDATFARTGTGFNNAVYSLAVQADGKVLVGGDFTTYNGTAGQSRLIRLNADGSRDAAFATGTGFNSTVNSLVVQPDGKVLVGGNFTSYNGTTAEPPARLNADGTRDAAFATGTGFNTSACSSLAVQADGKVLAGGDFTTYNGTAARLPGPPQRRRQPQHRAHAVTGATFTFSPGNTTTNPLVTSTAGTYTATASLNGETSAASNTVTLTACLPVISSLTPPSGRWARQSP